MRKALKSAFTVEFAALELRLATPMSRRFINTLSDGETIEEVYLLADKQLRANRNAALYLLVELRDRSGAMNARMWNVTEEAVAHFGPGDFVHVKGKVQLFQGALQMIVSHVHPVPSERLDPADFVRQSSRDVGQLTARLREIRAPTLVIAGEGDRAFTPELLEATAAGITGARLVLYRGRGHIGAMIDPRFGRDVAGFLNQGERS